jgi:hypothetical protein
MGLHLVLLLLEIGAVAFKGDPKLLDNLLHLVPNAQAFFAIFG